jgi:hypothetical protein
VHQQHQDHAALADFLTGASMSVLSPKAESLLNTLASQPGVTPQHMAGLRDAITSSPALVDLFNAPWPA